MMQCSETEAKRFQIEVLKCRKSFAYFCDTYCQILSESGRGGEWIPFCLWPEQRRTARLLQDNLLVVVLKARQLGLTWLVLAFALWLMLFHPIATVLLFSRRDDEATDLLAVRLRGMHDRLPAWLQASGFLTDNDHEWALVSLVPDLDRLMRAVKPTIDGGGRMVLLSRADKTRPLSPFKRIYDGASKGENGWTSVFLSWRARPDRDAAWYEGQRRDILARTGAVDDLHEQYPASDAEALAPRALDKRLPAEWLTKCYQPREPVSDSFPSSSRMPPAIPGLAVYALPLPGHRYVVGADPAEGNPTSDPSALEVLDVDSGEEVAALAGRYEPATFAAHVAAVSRYYNSAAVLVERNNHGHAVLLWLRDNARLTCLVGPDGKAGWQTTTKSKALLYDHTGETLRDGEAIIHGLDTFAQLASIEGSTLRAPEGQADDRATAFALALAGRVKALLLYPSSSEAQGPCILTPGREPEACFGPVFATPRGRPRALEYGADGGPPEWW
jgi:hypothetical protein